MLIKNKMQHVIQLTVKASGIALLAFSLQASAADLPTTTYTNITNTTPIPMDIGQNGGVTIKNTSPVPISGTLNIGKMPAINATLQDPTQTVFSMQSAGNGPIRFGSVPAGNRFVIEEESVLCTVPSGGQIFDVIIHSVYTSNMWHIIPMQKTGDDGSNIHYVGTSTFKLYADPQSNSDNNPYIVLESTDETNNFCNASISGHLIPLP